MCGVGREAVVQRCDGVDVGVLEECGEGWDEGLRGDERVAEGAAVDVD